ncbi:hypothetical protein [Pseudoflavonifractor sp. MCC625]|uniref:hypothetical protein n=1 Tax=Pseudoflavonifractor sp. MCC625 TaxID=2592647 RepID=UPI001C012F73|nr:hypothetical protein [Pseudoflavonifractor sp. MCC625]MBT9685177.1 hypothetical protein [Pseudoflavonifractor sp. MCC625]
MSMRSEVCKRANALVKTGYYSKSAAFKKAWAEVKFEAISIKAPNLTTGDAIRVEYGREGNFVNCIVTEVEFDGRYYIVKADYMSSSMKGYEVEFCARPESRYEKIA